MLFHSIDFVLFLPIVFVLYWIVLGTSIRWQNILLVVASYVFYAWWDVRFLSLLMVSTVIDYSMGICIEDTDDIKRRKRYLCLSIVTNLSILGFFKYYDFFVVNFAEAFTFFGMHPHIETLNIILPVGISFYTFQTMSYTIDVYRHKMEASRDIVSFAAFVSFFPQLVAGPIERATRLLPQFGIPRVFSYSIAVDGSRQILWGFFKKLVIADNCAIYADMFFNHADDHSGSNLLLGAFFFTFQIYGDFSGYSDIAIGTARLFGFDLMKNFSFPYFARDLGEFWRRWHISLTTWFRDYVYIPLGGNQGSHWTKGRNVFIVFMISGFWHGAEWTFVWWGLLNAILFLPLILLNTNRRHLNIVASDTTWPSFLELFQMLRTFVTVLLLWILFRAESLTSAKIIYSKIFSSSVFTIPSFERKGQALVTVCLILFFIIIEWFGRKNEYAIEGIFANKPWWYRWTWYALLMFLIAMYMPIGKAPFIYFQF